MNLRRLAYVAGFAFVVGMIIAGIRHGSGGRSSMVDAETDSDFVGSSLADMGPPATLAMLVEDASVIVVARYVASTSGVTVTLATPGSNGEPPEEFPTVNTEVVIDEVLKNDGDLEVSDHVVYSMAGSIPVGSTELKIDAAADFPHLWPRDTEFILFMAKEDPGSDWYYLVDGSCGRVLTGQATVSCSDGDRTVPGYMTGLSRAAYIDAVIDEIENPSPTSITP